MSTQLCRELLEEALEKGWADDRISERIENLRTTDPKLKELNEIKPNNAQAQILVMLNEEHVAQYARAPKRVVEALLVFMHETRHINVPGIRYVTETPDPWAFPRHPGVEQGAAFERVVFFPPYLDRDDNGNVDQLFSRSGTGYKIDSIIIEVIHRKGGERVLRLHLGVPNTRHEPNPHNASYAYLTIDTDGQVHYEHFTINFMNDRAVRFGTGIFEHSELVQFVSHGRTEQLDFFFRGAKKQLAEDLQHLPGFIQARSGELIKNAHNPGFRI